MSDARAWQAAPDLVDLLDGVVDRDRHLRVVAGALTDLLCADFVGRVALDLRDRSAEVRRHPQGGRSGDDVARHLLALAGDHPVVRSLRADRSRGLPAPRRLSDVATRAELLRNAAYVELLRPGGAEHQMTIPTARTGAGGRVWTVNRSGAEFSDRDLASARALQPVLALLDRTVGAHLAAAPDGVAAREELGLTAREVQVLGHVGSGLTADAVARLLRISDRTVHKHLENAYRKLDRHDRLLAVDRARELGVLPQPRRRAP
ncbi:regulatory LuxR family protein [Geodermatophilus normandii]|uniref:Regulatory LuxR family protein n=1 Tax=Geodermatophilus normandii TaxID=1137989 RepID=A0A317QEJ6_9ACTN|nr:helix-turn-helix domain-containing protein [Geodermatophilus normandii]PWW21016.1 regulatory LuxR family protein [Geodermatophilus normandii]